MLGFAPLGSIALGQPADSNKTVVGDAATITLTGQDAGLYANRVLTAEAAAFTVTFNQAELVRGRSGLNIRAGGGARGIKASSGGGARGLRIRA